MSECICEGNWRLIVSESQHQIGKQFRDTKTGKLYTFFGLVLSDDDYYYGLCGVLDNKLKLLSCVCNLEMWGMEYYETDYRD